MKTWEVWLEGFSCPSLYPNGNFGPRLLGKAKANTFQEACDRLLSTGDLASWYNRKFLSFWGCKLYDNAEDAGRKFQDPEDL